MVAFCGRPMPDSVRCKKYIYLVKGNVRFLKKKLSE